MQKLTEHLMAAFVVFVVTFIGQAIVSNLFSDRGEISVFDSEFISGKKSSQIHLTNWSGKVIDGLLVATPISFLLQNLNSTYPIFMEEVPNVLPGNSKVFKLSNFPSGTTVVLFFENIEAKNLVVMNANDKNLRLQIGLLAEDKNVSSLWTRVTVAALFSIFLVLKRVQYSRALEDFAKEREKFEEAIAGWRKDLSDAKNESSSIRRDLLKLQASALRTRLILSKKISDYRKELNYWRDTIRRIAYATGGTKDDLSALFEKVTAGLQTYGVKDNSIVEEAIIAEDYARLFPNTQNDHLEGKKPIDA